MKLHRAQEAKEEEVRLVAAAVAEPASSAALLQLPLTVEPSMMVGAGSF